MCSRCWQADPDRPLVRGENLIARLEEPPPWLREFVAYLAARHSPGRAAAMISTLGGLLTDDLSNHPQAVLDRARHPGRSIGSLARGLEDFFTARRLALPTDQAEQLAVGRRQRRIDAVPGGLRPAVQAFAAALLQNQERARRAGTRPRTEHTIDKALATIRDMALFLGSHRDKLDWALVDVHDVEAFLGVLPKARQRRLTVLRQYFRFARTHKVVLVDPTRGLAAKSPRGFTGRTLLLDRQRDLFRRWTTDTTAHPHEALLGILALLHGASSQEVRLLRCEDIDSVNRTVRLGRRPQPVPLDPATWSLLQRCLAHRSAQRTENPHVVVTRATKARKDPASAAYFTHLLDPCGIPPKMVRCTRLAELVNTMDPKLVAAAFGMNPEGVMFYLTDHVDDLRIPAARANPANP
jgi:site-specific recombinase XerD